MAGVNHSDPIDAVTVRVNTTHVDERGAFTEIWRDEWHADDDRPRQWTLCTSRAGTLRGMHVHRERVDQIVIVRGSMFLALHDIRPESQTHGAVSLRRIGPEDGTIRVPPGVVHGFWFDEDATYLLGFSHEWDGHDETACRFDDPELAIDWPEPDPLLSDGDRSAGSLRQLVADYLAPEPNAPEPNAATPSAMSRT